MIAIDLTCPACGTPQLFDVHTTRADGVFRCACGHEMPLGEEWAAIKAQQRAGGDAEAWAERLIAWVEAFGRRRN